MMPGGCLVDAWRVGQKKGGDGHHVGHRLLLPGWEVGLEPTTSRSTIWRSNQLNYAHRVRFRSRKSGAKVQTFCKPTKCFFAFLYRWLIVSVFFLCATSRKQLRVAPGKDSPQRFFVVRMALFWLRRTLPSAADGQREGRGGEAVVHRVGREAEEAGGQHGDGAGHHGGRHGAGAEAPR